MTGKVCVMTNLKPRKLRSKINIKYLFILEFKNLNKILYIYKLF